jgi:hypothetical protein
MLLIAGLLVAVAGSRDARPDIRMLDERAESTLCGVADLYIVGFGGGRFAWIRAVRCRPGEWT